jgi:hypothetical protein
MPVDCGLMPNDPVGFGDLAKGFALVPLLPAARLAGPAAKAGQNARLLPQRVAQGRLGVRRAVQIQPALKLSHRGPETFDLARLRGFKLRPPAEDSSHP